MHLPACDVSMREAFEAGFGGCPTYSTGYENHRYCHIDRDTISDLPVFGVCFECERCTAMMVCAGATAVAGYPLAMSTLESAVVPFCRAPEDALVAPVPTSAAGAAAARTCGSS